ncbi:hypothetical protein CC78DRAFT_529643 [Lojkania enalia]|uniref:Zn(2)-C6 fungal-type domain-containing protein n=1 Tax=Lojkania enalia TaxID=147567 RepID=A0A9P4TMS3_9PLEO|nr:hypothetical protein CC78DRAFT_529643 [Didymosphaeria enalia]
MSPHTRTRTGCWTCREAGYKCDEKKPYCGRCTRLKITCKGYGIKFKWKTTTSAPTSTRQSRRNEGRRSVDTKSKSSPIPTIGISSAPAAIETVMETLGINSPQTWTYETTLLPAIDLSVDADLSFGDKRLLNYWTEHLSSLISVTPRQGQLSPFQQHLTFMASYPGALRSTVLSMAANHLALISNNPSLRIHAYRHQRDAIHLLQQLIQEPTETCSDPALATVLMMQISARLFGGEDTEPQVANHLIGAKAMVTRRGGLAAWSASSSAQFLLSLLAYHDILSSVSRGTRPLLEHYSQFTAVEGVSSMQSIATVLHVVARISELQEIARLTRNPTENPSLSALFQTNGSEIEAMLKSLDFTTLSSNGIEATAESNDIRLTAEAYRHAAFIYLYRVWLDIGAPNRTTLHHVQECIACIAQISFESPLATSHTWPLFTAGCEAINDDQRQFVRHRFLDMFHTRKFPSLLRIIRDIEDVWIAKDTEHIVSGEDGMTKVDCIQVILRRRKREVDLA